MNYTPQQMEFIKKVWDAAFQCGYDQADFQCGQGIAMMPDKAERDALYHEWLGRVA